MSGDPRNNYLLLSVQRALLDAVVPELRAVTVDFVEEEQTVYLRFFYDAEIDDRLFDLASCASAEIEIDPRFRFYPMSNADVAIEWRFPKELPVQGTMVYLRKEPMQQANAYKKTPLCEGALLSVQVRLYLQQALLGKVTPELRSVSEDIDPEKRHIQCVFHYDSEPSEEHNCLAREVVNEVGKAFPHFEVELCVVGQEYPERFPLMGESAWLVYAREEVRL